MLISLVAAVMLSTMATPVARVRADAGTVVQSSTSFPNYWWDHRHELKTQNVDLTANGVNVLYDPVRHLVIEANWSGACPSLVAYDTSGHLVATNPTATAGACSEPDGAAHYTSQGNGTKALMLALDDTDGLILTVQGAPAAILAISDTTLRVVGSIPVPVTDPTGTGTESTPVVGLSWSRAADQILLTTGVVDVQNPPNGVIVYDYDVRALEVGKSALQWSDNLSECSAPLAQEFATAVAYRSDHEMAAYVPCELSGSVQSPAVQGARDGVVKVALGGAGAGGAGPPLPTADTIQCSSSVSCPTGSVVVTPSPGSTADFIFDPVADRGFMPTQQQNTGVDVLVYDGPRAAFLGKAHVGGVPDYNAVAFGYDALAGRLYAIGQGDGMTVIDGRRTPLTPGVSYPQNRGRLDYVPMGTLPPDTTHPFTRLLVPFWADTSTDPDCPQCATHDLTVFQDSLPVTSDPPATAIDTLTYNGPVSAGTPTYTTYGAHARGYGVHADFVGGLNGVVADVSSSDTGVQNPPKLSIPAASSQDLLAGLVDQTELADGAATATASALGDGNGQASATLEECTNALQPSECAPPPQCPAGVSCPAPPPAPAGTAQQWPFPDAVCSQPGPVQQRQGVSAGFYTTAPSSGGTAPPSTTPVPGSDQAAQATVDCAAPQPAAGSAVGDATLAGLTLGESGLPSVSVATATSTTSVSPPAGAGGARSTTTSVARGVHIDLGAGNALDIGAITQTAAATAGGRIGTAHTTDTVTLDQVVVTIGGQRQDLCSGTCPDPATTIAQIDAAFPSYLHVMAPGADTPAGDARYGSGAAGNGSPGGYAAVVQANLTEQYGDRQFNLMSPEEATYLPALRIVLYGQNDGSPSVSRVIVDAAGVEDDAELGISVLPPETTPPTINVPQAQVAAGAVLSDASGAVAGSGGGTPPPPASPGPRNLGHDLLSLVTRTLDGLDWLRRDPLEALTMFATLAFLGCPVAVLLRRRSWIVDFGGDAQ